MLSIPPISLSQDGQGGAEDNGERCVEKSGKFKWTEIDGCAKVRIRKEFVWSVIGTNHSCHVIEIIRI